KTQLAAQLYDQALAVARGFGSQDPRLVVTLHKVGLFYLYNAPSRAIPYFKASVKTMEGLPREQYLDLDLAMDYGNLAEAFMMQKNFPEAEYCAKKELSLKEALLHKDDGVLVRTLMRVADCEIFQNQFPEAQAYLEQASRIAREQKFAS